MVADALAKGVVDGRTFFAKTPYISLSVPPIDNDKSTQDRDSNTG
jgi:hypothetical protein